MESVPSSPDPSHISTAGDYSPGIVMGNYTVNTVLTPMSVPLNEAFKISLELAASYRGYFIDIDGDRQAFVNGCRFDMRLGNGGTSDIELAKMYITVEVEDRARPKLPEKERGYGAFYVAHKLFIEFYRDGAPGWWLISEGMKHSEPRKFVDARRDLLESEPNSRFQIRLKPGEMETIEGGLIPREDGVFEVRFVFGIISATEKLLYTTDSILLIKGDMIRQAKNDGN